MQNRLVIAVASTLCLSSFMKSLMVGSDKANLALDLKIDNNPPKLPSNNMFTVYKGVFCVQSGNELKCSKTSSMKSFLDNVEPEKTSPYKTSQKI